MISKTLYTLCASLSILSAAYAGPFDRSPGNDDGNDAYYIAPGVSVSNSYTRPGYLGPNGTHPVRSYYTTNQGGTTTDASTNTGLAHLGPNNGYQPLRTVGISGTNASVDMQTGQVFDRSSRRILGQADQNGVVRDPMTGTVVARLGSTPSGDVFLLPITGGGN